MSSTDDLLLLSDIPLEIEQFANIGVWHYDLVAEKITWSSSLYAIYEIEEDDFGGTFEEYTTFLHPKELDNVNAVINKALKDKETFSFLKRIITGKGSEKHIRSWGVVILNDNEQPIRLTGMSMDVSHSIEAEKALKESEVFNRELVENTPSAVLIQRLDGIILYANQRASELIKAPSNEYLLGKNSRDFRPKNKQKNFTERATKVFTSGQNSIKVEQEFICVDGSKKFGESVMMPFEYKGEQAVLSIVNDITSQKEALEQLKNSESQYKFFIKNTPVGVAMFDKNMNYIACSKKYIEDWWVKDQDMTTETISGLNHYEIFPDVTDEWKKNHQQAQNGEVISRESDSFVKANGKIEWVRSKTQPWRTALGEIGGIILFTEFITERKKAEEEISSSRNRLSTLIQNLPGLVYSCGAGPDFSLKFVSEGSYDLTGYKPEAFFGENKMAFEMLVHPDDLDLVRTAMGDAVKNKEPFEISYRFYTKSGDLKYLNERGQALYAENGEPISIEGVVFDITESRQTQLELKTSEENLNQAQRVSHLGSWEWYIETNEVFWSDEYFRICGEQPDAFRPTFEIGASFIHPDDREHTENAIGNTLNTGQPYQINKRIIRKDGSIRYVQSQGELVKTSEGKPFKVIGSMQDITERRQAEMELEESRNRNLALVNALPDLLFVTTTDGYYLDVQVSEPGQLLVPKEKLIGSHIKDFYNEDVANRFIEKSQLADQTEENQILNYSLEKKDGIKHFEARIVKYEEGKILSVVRDVTKSREDEANLVNLTEELTTSNAELKQFAYITSHDLRAPVVNIDALLKLYTSERMDDEDRSVVLDKITSSVEQLKSTLNDLIQLVSVKDDSKNTLVKVNFKEVVKAITNSLETQIKSADAEVITDFKAVSYVVSRRPTVYSIIQNLISNGLKYTRDQKPLIKISTSKKEGYICLSVEDNGSGIDMKKHGDKLFDMYQRFHENKEGKGLGLYIIKSQIEALGGYIEVKSQINQGTVFNVYFKIN